MQDETDQRFFCPGCLCVTSMMQADALSDKCEQCGFPIAWLLRHVSKDLRDFFRVRDRPSEDGRLHIDDRAVRERDFLGKVFRAKGRRASADVLTATIGRNTGRDIYIDHKSIRPKHALLFHLTQKRQTWIVAHDAACSTRIDGQRIIASRVRPYDLIQLGSVVCHLGSGTGWPPVLNSPAEIDGAHVTSPESARYRSKGGSYQFHQGRDLHIAPGEFVAMIGESGCGKSTFLKILTGVRAPARGDTVRVEFDNDGERPVAVGYVPQNMPQATTLQLHDELTPRQALGYAARLRRQSPSDEGAGEQHDNEWKNRVETTLVEMGLGEQSDQRMRPLSGGQATRVSTAMELVAEPNVLFLDEPTTGLDPMWDLDTMRRLRLLSRRGPAVILTTHNLAHLDIVDKVVVLKKHTQKGKTTAGITFIGSPAQARERFGRDLSGVFDGRLDTERATADSAPPSDTGYGKGTERPKAARNADKRPPQRLRLLIRREWKRMFGARSDMAINVLLPIAIGLLFGSCLGSESTRSTLGFLTVVAMIWLGMNAGAPAIAGERAILQRELRSFLRPWAYVVAKFAATLGVVLFQAVLLVLAVLSLALVGDKPRMLPSAVSGWCWLFAILLTAGMTGLALGLLVSAWAPTRRSAGLVVVLAVLFQIIPSFEVAGDGKGWFELGYYDKYFLWDTPQDKPRERWAPRMSYFTVSRWADQAMRFVVLDDEPARSSSNNIHAAVTALGGLLLAAFVACGGAVCGVWVRRSPSG